MKPVTFELLLFAAAIGLPPARKALAWSGGASTAQGGK
jgi:hypothetical protein